MFAGYGPPPMAPGIIDVGREAPRTFIAMRGNPDAPGEEVQPGFLTRAGRRRRSRAAAARADPPAAAKRWPNGSPAPDNPLFARVMVNRIWQFHFGSGLVKTPSDFGIRARQPTHPELLDWLATEFAARKWSIKVDAQADHDVGRLPARLECRRSGAARTIRPTICSRT